MLMIWPSAGYKSAYANTSKAHATERKSLILLN